MLQQFGKLLLVGEALPSGNRHRTTTGHLDHGGDAGVRDRLFKPGRPELMNGLGKLDGRGHVEPAVALDQQIDRRTDSVPHCADDVYRKIEIVAGERAPARAERVEFEGSVSASGNLLGLLREALWRSRATIPAVGVSAQFFQGFPAM